MNGLIVKLAEPSTQIGLGQIVGLAGSVHGSGWIQIASLVLSALLAVLDIVRKERV